MLSKLKQAFYDSNKFITQDNLVFDMPKNQEFDFATNIAMIISKKIGKKPSDIASQIIEKLQESKINFEKLEVAIPGFINFRLSESEICQDLDKLREIKKSNGDKWVVDYSSPNIAKKMHIGHLRSTVIGDSLVKILRHFGHEVIGDSHIGDWGTQFGKLIYGYNNWLDKKAYQKDPIAELQRVYVKFHDEENDEMLNEAREILVKLQNQKEPYYSLWKDFCNKSLEEYQKIYDYLNINIDYQLGESFFNKFMGPLVDKLMNEKIAVEDKGAKIVYFDKKSKIPPAIIQKNDGGFLYLTSDLACIEYRTKEWKAKKAIYVVDSRQANHFQQVFALAKKAKFDIETYHAQFGIMSLEDGKISTRGGKSLDLQDLLDTGYNQALKIVNDKNPQLAKEEKEKIAYCVSTGAIKFFDLQHQRTSDIIFTWDKALSFNGKSAPYIQYAYTRINSLLNKANINIENKDIKVSNQKEREIIKTLYQYGKILNRAYLKLEPHHIANYLFKLTSIFNSWYSEVKVLEDSKNLNSRLFIIKEVQKTIKEGLGLLGIDVLERM